MERMEHSFEKNGKERKGRNVLLKRTDAQPCVKHLNLKGEVGDTAHPYSKVRIFGPGWAHTQILISAAVQRVCDQGAQSTVT